MGNVGITFWLSHSRECLDEREIRPWVRRCFQLSVQSVSTVAWENSRRFTRSPLEPSQNNVWVSSAEVPYWWRVSTQILVVLLISYNFLSTNQKHYQNLGSGTSSVWNFCARYSDVVLRGLKWRPRETLAVVSGYVDCQVHEPPLQQALKSHCHPKCFARRGTFFIYEKYAIFLIVVKSDLYLLPSLPLAIQKH